MAEHEIPKRLQIGRSESLPRASRPTLRSTRLAPVLVRVTFHTLVILAFLIVGLRTLGRRALAQLGVVDLVVLVLLGSAVETAMIAGHTELTAGLVSAATLLLANRAISAVLYRSRRLRHLVNGLPILLVHDGDLISSHLHRAGITAEDLTEALRQRGEPDLHHLHQVILEPNGTIHVIPAAQGTSGTARPTGP